MYVLSILVFLWPAVSSGASVCGPFSSFNRQIKRCEDNFLLSKEAMKCVQRFDEKIQAGQVKVQKILQKHIDAMAREQSDSYATTDTSYSDARKELGKLISEGQEVKIALATYLAVMQFPEDLDNPNVTGMSAATYMAQEPCFATPKKIIIGSSDLVEKMINDLKKSDSSAGLKALSSKRSAGKIKVMSEPAKVNVGVQGASGKADSGKRVRASDISGTKKEEKKRSP